MYWTDVLYMYILHWCVVCTGLVQCCLNWTGVMCVLDCMWCCPGHCDPESYRIQMAPGALISGGVCLTSS